MSHPIQGVFSVFMLCLAVFASCDFFDEKEESTLLAKAYNKRLYLEDLGEIFHAGVGPEDSTAILNRHVERWVQQQVLVHHAHNYMPEGTLDFERMVEEYRNSLIIFAFEKELARKEMDSEVTQAEIEAFYEENKQHFSLKENVVLANYIKLPLNAPDLRTIRSLYRSTGENELRQLEEYSLEHAATYFLGTDNWIVFSDILIDMPLDVKLEDQYLRNNRFVETFDDYYRYFLYIHDFRLKGGLSPLNLEEDNIRTLILSNRKKIFLADKRRDLYNQALESSKTQTWYK